MVANLRLEGWQALHQRLRGIAKQQRALDAEEAQCLREAHALQLWRPLGYVHMAEYLERELGYGPQVGAERLRVARALGELPQIEACLAEGGLAYSAVREVTRVATSETEQDWLEAVRGKSLRQIEGLVAGRKRGDRPDDASTPELITRVVRLELSPAAFALLRQTQSALAEEQGAHLDDSALVELLCRRALEAGGAADRPAHQIAYTVCESCQRAWQNGAGREIEVGPAVIERARCDAEWIGSLNAVQPARVTATVTPRTRRQVLARDHHRCTAPSCRSARNLDLHHIEYQQDGGRHEVCNITALCSGHHQQLHDGALEIRGKAPDALVFTWRARDAAEMALAGNVEVAEAAEVTADNASAVGTEVAAGDMNDRDAERREATLEEEARQALVAAGYSPRVARAAVASARPHVGDRATLAQLLRAALRAALDCQ